MESGAVSVHAVRNVSSETKKENDPPLCAAKPVVLFGISK